MGVAKKGKRTITVHDRVFLWYVGEDLDDFPPTIGQNDLWALNILSEDKKFIVRYHIGQVDESTRHITVLGTEFSGAKHNGKWRRFKCPAWCQEGSAQPRDVRKIIEWCLSPDKSLIEVDYKGRPLVNGE